jgi:glucokinase
MSIAVELLDGGSRMIATATTDAANPGRHWRRQLAAPPSAEDALATLNELIAEIVAESSNVPDALGIVIWGEVDSARGVTHAMPHADGWDGFPLAERLAARWQVPVRLASWVEAAGLAEATLGAGKGHEVALYVHSSRTVASALVIAGSLVPGASGRAGKLGHWLVAPDGPRCACGIRGHLDPIASAQSIVRATIGLASGSDESTAAMLRISGGRAEAMTVRQVVQLAAEGEAAARTVLENAWDALAVALANLVAALDPAIIVLGGAPAETGEAFCEPLRERLSQLCDPWRTVPDVVPGQLEPRAVLIGAHLLARRASRE